MSHKSRCVTTCTTREAWTEAVKIKRDIERGLVVSVAAITASQEVILQKQDNASEQVQRLTTIVKELKDHLQKKKRKVIETKPLRDGIMHELYQELMTRPTPRITRHALLETARKKIVFTLLYYTGARVNELREISYNDVKEVINEERLKLVLHKQREAIVRVIPPVGQEEIKKLVPEIEMFFKEQQCQALGQSFRKLGQVMHEKA